MKKRTGKLHLFAFIGALILLGIHGVRNHRKAWSTARPQVLYRLRDLLTCQLFELIGMFIHVVIPAEENAFIGNPLRKLQPLIDHIKSKCFECHQPNKEISIDKRIVKSKARCHLKQYMKSKPTKWGFKLWVLLKNALSKVPRGTGYYIQDEKMGIVYCVWKDTRVVSAMSTCHPGHQSEKMVSRNCLGADGKQTTMEIPRPNN